MNPDCSKCAHGALFHTNLHLSSSVKPWTTAIEIEHSCSVHPRNTDSILEFWKMIVHLTVMHDIFVSDNPKLWKKIKRKFGSWQKNMDLGGLPDYLAGLECAFFIYFANFNWQQKCYWICKQGWILYCICWRYVVSFIML